MVLVTRSSAVVKDRNLTLHVVEEVLMREVKDVPGEAVEGNLSF